MSEQNDPEQQPPEGQNPWVRQLMIWGGIFLALLLVVSLFGNSGQNPGAEIQYSEFREAVASGEVEKVQLGQDLITGTLKNREPFSTVPVPTDTEITKLLEENGVEFSGKQREEPPVAAIHPDSRHCVLCAAAGAERRRRRRDGLWQIEGQDADRTPGPRYV